MSEIDWNDLSNVPDGDYPTGKMSYDPETNTEYDEIIVIQQHQVLGFRTKGGEIYVIPAPDDAPVPPPISFPPLPPRE